jgi:hypothetical protein
MRRCIAQSNPLAEYGQVSDGAERPAAPPGFGMRDGDRPPAGGAGARPEAASGLRRPPTPPG